MIISGIDVNAVNVVSKLKVLYPLFLVILYNKLKYTKSIKIFATNTSQNSANYTSSVCCDIIIYNCDINHNLILKGYSLIKVQFHNLVK